MEYIQLFKKLQADSIRYLVCGGMAVNIYGIPRMTADVDLLLDFTEENIRKFDNLIKLLSYRSLIPVPLKNFVDEKERLTAIKEKNLIAYSYFNTQSNFMNVDVLMDTPLSFEELWKEKEIRTLDKTDINLVSVAHLITMKKYANRKQDVEDIILLSRFLKR